MARKGHGIDPDLKAPLPLVERRGRPPDPRRKRPVGVRHFERHGGEAVTRRKQKLKRILVEEAGGACCMCGYDRCILNLTFHHVDPRTKAFPMSMRTGKSINAFREEAKKCVLVCANCHGEIEAGLIESPPAGAKFRGARLRAA
jgi:hypothetical protein